MTDLGSRRDRAELAGEDRSVLAQRIDADPESVERDLVTLVRRSQRRASRADRDDTDAPRGPHGRTADHFGLTPEDLKSTSDRWGRCCPTNNRVTAVWASRNSYGNLRPLVR